MQQNLDGVTPWHCGRPSCMFSHWIMHNWGPKACHNPAYLVWIKVPSKTQNRQKYPRTSEVSEAERGVLLLI